MFRVQSGRKHNSFVPLQSYEPRVDKLPEFRHFCFGQNQIPVMKRGKERKFKVLKLEFLDRTKKMKSKSKLIGVTRGNRRRIK